MIRLQISADAFAVIVATLPGDAGFENKRAPNGDVGVWLDHATVAKLKATRGPGGSYSDAIIAPPEQPGSDRVEQPRRVEEGTVNDTRTDSR